MKPIDSMPGDPILMVAEPAPETFRYVKQLVDYDFLLFCRREVIEVFRDDLDCIVRFHAEASLPDSRERVYPGDGASGF